MVFFRRDIDIVVGKLCETFNRAAKVWIERMGQQMAVGQKFRQYLDAAG